MLERRRGAHCNAAATGLRVALVAVVALTPLAVAACGQDGGGDAAAGQTATATEAETQTETAAETATETAPEENATTGASPPPTPPGPVVRFQGSGDRTLGRVDALDGGATVVWVNGGEVFSLFHQGGMVVDSVGPHGQLSVPAGRYVLDVVASGDWVIEIRNARRAR